MGNPKPYPIYWDKMLLNASQVTNPSIDPLREPMEIRTILGRKPDKMAVEKKGKSLTKMPPLRWCWKRQSCFLPCLSAQSA